MDKDELCREVERAVRRSQVDAVMRAIERGHRPRVGELLEHTFDLSPATPRRGWTHNARLTKYEFEVEPWHLAEAELPKSPISTPPRLRTRV